MNGTPLNPMATPVFPDEPGRLVGMSVWVLQIHTSNRAPVWNGPLPDEFAANGVIAHVEELQGQTDEELGESYTEDEIAALRDIALLMKYRAEVSLTPIDKNVSEELRSLGFQLPHRKENDGPIDAGG